ncbi:MAG: hypothetical protein AVDCRST_MAG42-3050 [uncultured Chthoniobacterales bacterium]|uniref:Uncharacterized protein n=1 Tax=uncultured Chthoniobacterales bacterium TaxID=1836801 RepID=A0A6J4J2F3_9BACT|nr:MAG: hypothetical protein AVDCRST_MAG42-3050 [uncultured Chthoniobacterales bacterium]
MPAKKKQGLYANIHAKQERIKKGSGEKMRKPNSKGAPSDEAFRKADKTATKPAKAASKKQPASKKKR